LQFQERWFPENFTSYETSQPSTPENLDPLPPSCHSPSQQIPDLLDEDLLDSPSGISLPLVPQRYGPRNPLSISSRELESESDEEDIYTQESSPKGKGKRRKFASQKIRSD